jgi:hypothetical protein
MYHEALRESELEMTMTQELGEHSGTLERHTDRPSRIRV